MKSIILLIFLVASLNAFSGTCTSDSYTPSLANTVLTSTKYNSDNSTLYDRLAGNLDAGCLQDNTLEAAALNNTEFAPVLNGIHEGCLVSKSDAATISVDKCLLSIGGNMVQTTSATTATWGGSGFASEAASTDYYVYAKTTSTGSTLDLLFSTTAPNNDGFDGSGNKALGKFRNDPSSDIDSNVVNWHTNKFIGNSIRGISVIREEQSSGTDGGGSSTGYQTRVLNTTSGDTSFLSLASNLITLEAGTYYIWASAPAYASVLHKAKLYNETDSANVIVGTSSSSADTSAGTTRSLIKGIFTLAAAKTLSIHHYISSGKAINGLGLATSSGDNEVYTEVLLIKLE